MQDATSAGSFSCAVLTNPQQATPFHNMTYRSYVPLLATLGPDSPGVAVGATLLTTTGTQEPAGLALAQIAPDGPSAQLVSLFVPANFRHRHIATRLVAELEQALIQRGLVHIFGVYPSGKETTPYLERLLAGLNWTPPRPRMYLFQASQASLESMLNAPWVKPAEFGPEYTLVSWGKLTAEDHDVLQKGLETGVFPQELNPYSEEHSIDRELSQGLRYNGELYGWIVCHRLAGNTTRYTSLFVRPDIPQKGLGLRLFGDTAYRQLQRDQHTPNITSCWGILASNPFAGFIQRQILRFMPDATVSLTQEVEKMLVPVP